MQSVCVRNVRRALNPLWLNMGFGRLISFGVKLMGLAAARQRSAEAPPLILAFNIGTHTHYTHRHHRTPPNNNVPAVYVVCVR